MSKKGYTMAKKGLYTHLGLQKEKGLYFKSLHFTFCIFLWRQILTWTSSIFFVNPCGI